MLKHIVIGVIVALLVFAVGFYAASSELQKINWSEGKEIGPPGIVFPPQLNWTSVLLWVFVLTTWYIVWRAIY